MGSHEGGPFEAKSLRVFPNLSFIISYPDLIKLPYFADLPQRGDRGWKGGPKTG
jgi:hypothetical protein